MTVTEKVLLLKRTRAPVGKPLRCFLFALTISSMIYCVTLYDFGLITSSRYTDSGQNNEAEQSTTESYGDLDNDEDVRYFVRPKGTEHLQCAWVMDGNHSDYVNRLASNRTKFSDPTKYSDLAMDCASIKLRNRFASSPTSTIEAQFPIAYVRNVFTDYFFLEMVLAASYQPQNYYCYSLDKKSNDLFKMRMQALVNCFPNVFISNQTRWLDSYGHNQDWAHLDCMKLLAAEDKKWKYVQLLQNHDFPLKTNYETVHIFKLLNGSNDIQTTKEHGRVNYKLNWSFANINIFKNESRMREIPNHYSAKLTFVKGNNALSISREAVDYIFDELNITKVVSMIDDGKKFAVDEVLFPTLLSNDDLRVPGHYTQKCVKQGVNHSGVTRMAFWSYLKPKCYSKYYRHAICIFGVADISKNFDPYPFINGNKMLPGYDFNAITCWMEVLYNRTFLEEPTTGRLQQHLIKTLPFVRFQRYKDENGRVSKEALAKFKCKG